MVVPMINPVADRARGIVDELFVEGALQELPFLQTTVRLARAHASQGDLRLARRTARFLGHLRDIPDEAGARFLEGLKASNEGQRVGETLLTLLDRADDTRKADLLGSLTRGYILRSIGWPTFQALSDAIDRCPVDDLRILETLTIDRGNTR